MVRPRQPISLIEARGKKHLTKDEIESRKNSEVKAKSDKIKPPSYLQKELKKEFNKIAKELKELDIMSNLDCDCLARFLISQSQYIKITQEVQIRSPMKTITLEKKDKEGNVIDTKEVEVINDDYDSLLLMQDRMFKQCRQAASDLGLTISSRCRLVVPKTPEKPKNKFEKFGVKHG